MHLTATNIKDALSIGHSKNGLGPVLQGEVCKSTLIARDMCSKCICFLGRVALCCISCVTESSSYTDTCISASLPAARYSRGLQMLLFALTTISWANLTAAHRGSGQLIDSTSSHMLRYILHVDPQQQLSQGMPVQVVNAAASGVCSFAVDRQGRVWAWGTSKRGQLGLGQDVTHTLDAMPLPGLEGISQVACGWGHAAAVTCKPPNPLLPPWPHPPPFAYLSRFIFQTCTFILCLALAKSVISPGLNASCMFQTRTCS